MNCSSGHVLCAIALRELQHRNPADSREHDQRLRVDRSALPDGRMVKEPVVLQIEAIAADCPETI